MEKPLLVLKVGTSSITQQNGTLHEPILVEVARQIALLHASYRLVIVSSGAVGTGKTLMKQFNGGITERKAAAAIGNPILLAKYAQFLSPYGITIAQSLCERQHFSDRKKFLQLRETFEMLWDNEVVPIANENDVVSSLELKFSDNDELATLIAVGFGAELLLIGTSVPGVLNAQNQLVTYVEEVNAKVLNWARKDTSSLGLGGMISKLTFARLATKMGIQVVIFGIQQAHSIIDAIERKTGTYFEPEVGILSARKKWLASGSLVRGSVQIDEGACKALLERKSLLAVGIQKIIGDFTQGEVFEILDTQGELVGLGRAKVASEVLSQMHGKKGLEVAHADEIVLL